MKDMAPTKRASGATTTKAAAPAAKKAKTVVDMAADMQAMLSLGATGKTGAAKDKPMKAMKARAMKKVKQSKATHKGEKSKVPPTKKGTKPVPKIKFPGKPKKATPPMKYMNWTVYTDVKGQKWRCKRTGERKDIACSYKHDAEAGWTKVLEVISGK